MEKYSEPKFKTVFPSNNLPKIKKSYELIKWFRRFHNICLAPEYKKGSSGNLSFRYKDGFIIKGTKTYFRNIKPNELVFIKKFDLKNKVTYCIGKNIPSTELQMHHLIYEKKKSVNAVFHVHDYKIMGKAEKYGIPVTKVTEAGTEKIGYDVLRCLNGKNNFVIMKNHGVVAVGKTMKEAGNLILKYHKIAVEELK